jgi:hypothetical protein
MPSGPFRYLETVAIETPASRATSSMVVAMSTLPARWAPEPGDDETSPERSSCEL